MRDTKKALKAAIEKIKNKRLEEITKTSFKRVRTSEQRLVDAAEHLVGLEGEELLTEMSPMATVVTVATFASDAKKFGDKSANLFRGAAAAVSRQQSGSTLEDRIKAMETALYQLAAGLEAQRYQIGSLVSLNVAGHLLAIKSIKEKS